MIASGMMQRNTKNRPTSNGFELASSICRPSRGLPEADPVIHDRIFSISMPAKYLIRKNPLFLSEYNRIRVKSGDQWIWPGWLFIQLRPNKVNSMALP